jgi:hypothetical protein
MNKVVRRLLLCVVLLSAATAVAQIEITLKRDFIDKFADRVTIDANLQVQATSKIHSAKQDGDIHVAGTAPEIGLMTVAEVMNAKTERTASVKTLVDAIGHNPVHLVGAWRIWAEHGGEQNYHQGEPTEPAADSGVAHIFEIHPIIEVGGRDISHTVEPISGFTYKVAEDAFQHYERTKSHISTAGNEVTISTEQAAYNYTEFVARLRTGPGAMDGGAGFFADILDVNGDLLVHDRRLVTIAGTEAHQILSGMKKGDLVQVVGVPRVSLKLVKWRLENHTKPKFSRALDWNLPYELIIVAVTDDRPNVSE